MAAGVPIPFTITPGALPTVYAANQGLFNAMASRLQLSLNDNIAFFTSGGAEPTSNTGPWLKDGNTWYVWYDNIGAYAPVQIPQESLRYAVGITPPEPDDFEVWFQISSTGAPFLIRTYNTTTSMWEAFTQNTVGDIKWFNGTASDITNFQNALGWYLANGGTVNGHVTANLMEKFLVGAGGTYNVGDTGGAASIANFTLGLPANTGAHVLTTAEMPAHAHGFNLTPLGELVNAGLSAGAQSLISTTTVTGSSLTISNTGGGGSHTHPLGGTTDPGGGHDNRPPYYAAWLLEFCGIPGIAA